MEEASCGAGGPLGGWLRLLTSLGCAGIINLFVSKGGAFFGFGFVPAAAGMPAPSDCGSITASILLPMRSARSRGRRYKQAADRHGRRARRAAAH